MHNLNDEFNEPARIPFSIKEIKGEKKDILILFDL